MKNETIETRTSRLYMDEDGIMHSVLSPGVEITFDDVKNDFAVFSKITGGKRAPCLTDLRGIKSINRDAREYLSDSKTTGQVSASALLIGSPVSKVIGNFFLGLNKPPYPTRLFTSESKALAWLKGFVDKDES